MLAPRHGMIKALIYSSSALYGLYLVAPGPVQNFHKQTFTMSRESGVTAFFTSHFYHTELHSFLWNMGVLYTVGNWHALKYGCLHFSKVAGIGALAGVAAIGYQLVSN